MGDRSDSDGATENSKEWEDWSGDEDGAAGGGCLCLFCALATPTSSAVLEHCAAVHNFNVIAIRRDLGLDFYGTLRMINFVRAEVANAGPGRCTPELQASIRERLVPGAAVFADDRYLKPVLEDDQLLFSFEDADSGQEGDDDDGGVVGVVAEDDGLVGLELAAASQLEAGGVNGAAAGVGGAVVGGGSGGGGESVELLQLRQQVTHLKQVLGRYKEMMTELQSDDDSQSSSSSSSSCGSADESECNAAVVAPSGAAVAPAASAAAAAAVAVDGRRRRRPRRQGGSSRPDNDTYYFTSYAHYGIHEDMLRDEVRTSSYMRAIQENPDVFRGKVVLDVGCGTGVLSMFAARAGARRVIGVDMSDIIETARKIVADNGFSHVITLIKGKAEEVELPADLAGARVDVIVSEWMGYALVYESMLESVLRMRDRWLVPGGVVYPNAATMFVEAMEESAREAFWADVYGLDMRAMVPKMRADAASLPASEPGVEVVPAAAVCSSRFAFKTFDIPSMREADLDFTSRFSVAITRPAAVTALVVSFDCSFDQNAANPVSFSTGPAATPTHWKQTTLYLPRRIELPAGAVLAGSIQVRRGAVNQREMDILLTLDSSPALGADFGVLHFHMSA